MASPSVRIAWSFLQKPVLLNQVEWRRLILLYFNLKESVHVFLWNVLSGLWKVFLHSVSWKEENPTSALTPRPWTYHWDSISCYDRLPCQFAEEAKTSSVRLIFVGFLVYMYICFRLVISFHVLATPCFRFFSEVWGAASNSAYWGYP
jgi:hypothetical protein